MHTTPVRTAIIGAGRAGWGMHCTELEKRRERFSIVAGCDTHAPWRERFASRYPDALVTDSISDLLERTDAELVAIATRSVDHFDHAMQALAAGRIVFLEKPMCSSYEQAVRLREASAAGPGTLFVRHNRRFEPGFRAVRSIIQSGILGEIAQIRLARTSFGRRNDWQTLLEYGGGQLSNWGSHIVDHGLQFLGAPAQPLRSLHGHLARVAAVGDAEDHVKVVMTGAAGTIVDIEISGGAATPSPEYVVWGSRGGLVGEGNSLRLRYLDPGVDLPPREVYAGVPGSRFTQPSGKLALGNRTIGSNFGQPEDLAWVDETRTVPAGDPSEIWDHLHESIRGGKEFPVSLDEAVEVMRVIQEVRAGTPFEQDKRSPGEAR